MSFLTKMLLKELFTWAILGQNVGQVGSKMAKKIVFIPATLLPTQFSLETKFLTAMSPNTLSKLKDELTDLHKIL